MEKAKGFEDLIVWRKAHQFVMGVYKLTSSFPSHERFGLTSQFRRAAVSTAANIAEGFRRRTGPDKAHFLTISAGSLEECRYYLILSRDLEYTDDTHDLWSQSTEVAKLIQSYRSTVMKAAQRKGKSIQ